MSVPIESKSDFLQPVKVALTPQQRFNDYLQSRSMRNTEQRRTVLDCVFKQHDHFDVDQLLERLPGKGSQVMSVGRRFIARWASSSTLVCCESLCLMVGAFTNMTTAILSTIIFIALSAKS